MIADIVVDLQYGDCGKGKVTHHLCKIGDYTHVIRYNGGCNAGHTIFHQGKKFITHHIPAGVFFGIKSIIGPGCVLNINQFFKEIGELEDGGIKTSGLIYIAKNTHIITEKHLMEDGKDTTIGTTKKGNGPAYRDKYDRKGIRAEQIPELEPYLVDIYEELHVNSINPIILLEGAQGFGLDIDWGDYPYVTSSHCTAAAALLNGIPPRAIRDVWGVAKAYETYVGAKKFHGEDPIFDQIQEIGEEYGATTGRKRQVNWMNIGLLRKAAQINGVTHLVINKMDILNKIKKWSVYNPPIPHTKGEQGNLVNFFAANGLSTFIQMELKNTAVDNFYFSESPHHI